MKRECVPVFVAVGAMSLGAAQLDAATVVQQPYSGEPSHQLIFNSLYGDGGDFTGDPATGFTNGIITATRVDDADDAIWGAGNYQAEAVAGFAGLGQVLGIVDGESGGDFQSLFQTTGSGYNRTGSATFTADGSFRFARQTPGDDAFVTSLDTDNVDGQDKLVTYLLTGDDFEEPTYLLFWEDLLGPKVDGDFQDLVVRLTMLQSGVVAPTPAAFGAGVVLLGGLLLRRRRC